MEITHGLKKAYGFYVGTVSKVIYPISVMTSAAGNIGIKALAFNFLISLPYRASETYYSRKDLITKTKTILNINAEYDTIKKISTAAAVTATFFDSEQRTTLLKESISSAKSDENNVEYVLCIDGLLCPKGDQYGLFDLLYDHL